MYLRIRLRFLFLYEIYLKKKLDHCRESYQRKEVPVEEKKCLFSLNQVIIAQDADNLEFILKRLNKAYKEGSLTINFNKTEFIAINTDQEFHINVKENVTIKWVQNFKYLGVSLNKKGINSKDIVNKICKEDK